MAIAAAGISVIGGISSSIINAKKEKKAREAIQNYKRQELDNAYKDVKVSTLSSQLQREELARSTASTIQALRSGGVRSVIGGVGSIQERSVLASRSIGADLDRQQQNIDQLKANDEARIRQMTERREEGDLAGLGQQMNVAAQGRAQGINTAISGVGSLIGSLGTTSLKDNQQNTLNNGLTVPRLQHINYGGVGGGAVGSVFGQTNTGDYLQNNNPYHINIK